MDWLGTGRRVPEMETNLVDEYPSHVAFSSFQGAERTPEVELDVILFALHAHPNQNAPLRIQVEPQVVRKIVTEAIRVQTKIGSPNSIVLADECPIADAGHQP
jgi:hypothetical protein